MDNLIILAIIFYLLSSLGYIAYLFRQKDGLQKTGLYLMMAGFLGHSVAIGYRIVTTGHLPVNNLYETLILAGWTIAGVFLIITYKYNLKILGVYAAPLVLMTTAIASLVPNESAQSQYIFKNFWLVLHILSVFIGEATFALAGGVGVLYILQEKAIKTRSHGFFYKRLPSLELLDTTGYACIVTGFTLLTLGLITGMVYAKSIWGSFWTWDPKEVWSAVSWLLYAALLHQRITIGLRGRKAAIMAIIGFVVLLFTFLGVNLLLQGHHNEFTRW
jgi:cytochrome c-type biogenesis protein CcsB